ncbi:6-phosphogluconolactonase [Oscillospiraceae bacterium LTW-04]|nr:6-phosphogluconolactonase [Oscillospiraceae bacterium MB24-C1]
MNMTINVKSTPVEMGNAAAIKAAAALNDAIATKGKARLVLSTGSSQFDTISALIKQNVDWSKVEMFHLDEYVNLPESHPASFRKYLKERFTSQVTLKSAFFVDGEGDVASHIAQLSDEIRKEPVDVGLIGIGENAHIAFNDPPANFETDAAYMVVNLDDKCKNQQVGEGWFATIDDVPKQAITMTVKQILACKTIISCVPHAVKAQAIKDALTLAVTPQVPATILKTHPDWHLFIDNASASGLFQV